MSIETNCDNCSKLGDNIFCDNCLDDIKGDAFEEGKKTGYDNGYADGFESGKEQKLND
jgi:hypothetical protein